MINTETIYISTMNSNSRIAATLYSLGTYFVSEVLSINTLPKGDDDDDDDNNNNNNNNINNIY